MKDEVKRKESSPSPGAAELELVRWTQSDGGAERCCEPSTLDAQGEHDGKH